TRPMTNFWMTRRWIVALAALTLAGCAVGPDYKKPQVPTAPQFRGAEAGTADKPSLAETKWADLFQDDTLKGLIRDGLTSNFDVRIAAERVLQARASLGISESQLFPTVNATGQFSAVRNSRIGANRFVPPGVSLDSSYTQAGFSLGWELDVWGRIRRLNESARAQYLASEEARHGVITTLVSDISTTYFSLRELDLELAIAQKTKDIAQKGLQITTARHDRGAATGLDVHQAEQFLYTATAQIASIERQIAQTENAMSLLLGRSPGDVPRGKALEEFALAPSIPAGLPSALLERRPDIRQAEQTLIAANAQIGAAKAQYFPQISLTSFLGGQSRALTNLLTGDGRSWNFVPAAALPIFNAGRIRNNVRLTEAQQREAVLNYQKSIQTAFREVSDSLIGYRKISDQKSEQESLVKALRESDRLSTLRYQGGLDSYLQVLDAERNLFTGELLLAQLRREELLSVVRLYRALGGGWQ
ncbi:MAG: efflux transporter outer membrane subunit, partial [Bryobacteraceae bacterium]